MEARLFFVRSEQRFEAIEIVDDAPRLHGERIERAEPQRLELPRSTRRGRAIFFLREGLDLLDRGGCALH
jgi:hypothetical protein